MGADKRIVGDLSVFSVGGNSMLASLESVTYDAEGDTVNSDTVKMDGRAAEVLARGATITANLFSTISDGLRVSSLDLTVFTIGGTDYLGGLKSLRFNGDLETGDAKGAAEAWKWNQWKGKKNFTADIDLFLSSSAYNALIVSFHNSDRTLLDVTLSFTLNAVAITLPMKLTKVSLPEPNGEFQVVTLSLKGKRSDTLATAFPVAPTGTATLLAQAFNAPGTALAFVLTTKTGTGLGESISGNMVFSKFGFTIEDGQLVKTDYTWLSQGTVAAVATP